MRNVILIDVFFNQDLINLVILGLIPITVYIPGYREISSHPIPITLIHPLEGILSTVAWNIGLVAGPVLGFIESAR